MKTLEDELVGTEGKVTELMEEGNKKADKDEEYYLKELNDLFNEERNNVKEEMDDENAGDANFDDQIKNILDENNDIMNTKIGKFLENEKEKAYKIRNKEIDDVMKQYETVSKKMKAVLHEREEKGKMMVEEVKDKVNKIHNSLGGIKGKMDNMISEYNEGLKSLLGKRFIYFYVLYFHIFIVLKLLFFKMMMKGGNTELKKTDT
jgi:archaellum component FlaC